MKAQVEAFVPDRIPPRRIPMRDLLLGCKIVEALWADIASSNMGERMMGPGRDQ